MSNPSKRPPSDSPGTAASSTKRPPAVNFDRAARIPAPGDNVAIATRRLEAGTPIVHGERRIMLAHTVMEGHRFVLDPIARGAHLLSWGLPFGTATRDLEPGEYACNAKILSVLAEREIDFELPGAHNFEDHLEPHRLDEATFTPGEQLAPVDDGMGFMGYRRPGTRGVGTRNVVVVLATTAPAAAFATAVAERFEARSAELDNVDAVVAVTHTEGGGERRPNNLDFVLRALAGFMVHPNVAAVLALDFGTEPFTNDTLAEFMQAADYPLDDVPHAFMRIAGAFDTEVARASAYIEKWLLQAERTPRTKEPLAELKLALQCGGSDAFSGISGNALAGWVAGEVVRRGGAANLAETDELIGAEPYVLSNVRDLATARRFLEKIDIFKQRAADHGASAEGNPSGGNNYRGLYNITLKSIGAARKKDPHVRLDFVADYAQPMREGGYYFMDSPGNDLESIAGQVASGANLILFITGNGSITNFPFVPTLKFVTTSGRFAMLENEMDVNAGRYNDGMPMDKLGAETLALACRIASGERSKGELAGHAQVQLWRDWPQRDGSRVAAIRAAARPGGQPLPVRAGPPSPIRFEALAVDDGHALDRVGLIMPTSLCSGQVARLIAEQLNARARSAPASASGAVSRFVALVHTEGCGSVNAEDLYLQTLLGHLLHPSVRCAVLLEHGCEKTHNDAVRHYLAEHGVDPARYGFASVQLDGGIAAVTRKVVAWFDEVLGDEPFATPVEASAGALRIGITASGDVPDATAAALGEIARGVVASGGTVVVPANAPLLGSTAFAGALFAAGVVPAPSVGYGEPAVRPGLHVMDAPTESATETLTGLGGTGVELIVAHVGRAPLEAHPMIPLLQVSGDAGICGRFGADLDAALTGDADSQRAALEGKISAAASRIYTPRLYGRGLTGFQLTRGLLGLSL